MDQSTTDKIDEKIAELLSLCREEGWMVFIGAAELTGQTSLIMRSEGGYAFAHWLFSMVLHEQAIEENIEFEELLEHFAKKAIEASEGHKKMMTEMLNKYNKEDK